jgi:hypothetical protein
VSSRETIIARLHQDLVGPHSPNEELDGRPSDTYLTGILWPRDAVMGGEEDEKLGAGDEDATSSVEAEPALAGLRKPCSIGLSFAARTQPGRPASIVLVLAFGTYLPEKRPDVRGTAPDPRWSRRQHRLRLGPIPLSQGSQTFELASSEPGISLINESTHDLPRDLQLHLRSVRWGAAWLTTATIINNAVSPEEKGRDASETLTLFQVGFEVSGGPDTTLVARPSRRSVVDDEDRNMALLYRKAKEFAVGHTASAAWNLAADGTVSSIGTTWLPQAAVAGVRADGHPYFQDLFARRGTSFSARWLADAGEDALVEALSDFANTYRAWICDRENELAGDRDLEPDLVRAGALNLDTCRSVLARIDAGVLLLKAEPSVRAAFQLANRAMQLQFSWSQPDGVLTWRPFQLGFVLLSLSSLVDRGHPDREVMDLLWFPTGGGKTEAYLALVALISFHRRLRQGGTQRTGVAAIMRYTLRLLTTQQFARATALMMACEAIRRGSVPGRGRVDGLGSEPFGIGLWVGGDASPNTFDDAMKGLSGSSTAASPRQVPQCPCCRGLLHWQAIERERTVRVTCNSSPQRCLLAGSSLPIWTVDEDIYRRRPTLLIGTVDKFAQIVRRTEIVELFGVRSPWTPDLVIQDELHLISGPLGTIAGLYETMVDLLFGSGGSRPKILGSTATIRRAEQQVRALFDRQTCQFPPPGLEAGDSGFAVQNPDPTRARIYVGLSTVGRSAKFTLQAVAGVLLQAVHGALVDEEKDPYATLVCYFNSLRELGGALVLMQDDVPDSIKLHADRHIESARSPRAVEELTSRRSQREIIEMLSLLETRHGEDGALDVLLASNMLSVGVDVSRLGLMLVNGQPKGIAEYIQATSRVGRRYPGLVVTLLNNGRPRDRSHFETFGTWHATLYRDVEATSVTPFASRARDKGLHAVLVGLVRHLVPGMLDSPQLNGADPVTLEHIVDAIVARARRTDPEEGAVRSELEARLDAWRGREALAYWSDAGVGGDRALLQSAENAVTMRTVGRGGGAAWATPNSMRNVEASVSMRLKEHFAAPRRTQAQDVGGGSDNGE